MIAAFDYLAGKAARCNKRFDFFAELPFHSVAESVEHGGGAENDARLHTVYRICPYGLFGCGKAYCRELRSSCGERLERNADPGSYGAAAEGSVFVYDIDFCGGSEVNDKAWQLIEIGCRHRSGNEVGARLRRVVRQNVNACFNSGAEHDGVVPGYALCRMGDSAGELRNNGAYSAAAELVESIAVEVKNALELNGVLILRA